MNVKKTNKQIRRTLKTLFGRSERSVPKVNTYGLFKTIFRDDKKNLRVTRISYHCKPAALCIIYILFIMV